MTPLTPKDKRPIPAIKSHLQRWLKTQRRKDALPKKNLYDDFKKIRRSNSRSVSKSPTKQTTLSFQDRRITELKKRADYHYEQYKYLTLQYCKARSQRVEARYGLPKNQQAAYRFPSSNNQASTKTHQSSTVTHYTTPGSAQPQIVKSGYYHPIALNNRPDLQVQRYLRTITKQAILPPQHEHANNVPVQQKQRNSMYVWPKQINQAPPKPQRIQQPCCHHNPPPRSRKPLSVSTAKAFILGQDNKSCQRSNSFAYTKI